MSVHCNVFFLFLFLFFLNAKHLNSYTQSALSNDCDNSPNLFLRDAYKLPNESNVFVCVCFFLCFIFHLSIKQRNKFEVVCCLPMLHINNSKSLLQLWFFLLFDKSRVLIFQYFLLSLMLDNSCDFLLLSWFFFLLFLHFISCDLQNKS